MAFGIVDICLEEHIGYLKVLCIYIVRGCRRGQRLENYLNISGIENFQWPTDNYSNL